MRIRAGIALAAMMFSVPVSAKPAEPERKPDKTYVYAWKDIDGLDNDALRGRRRQDQAIIERCDTLKARSALLGTLIVAAFNALAKAANKAITTNEEKYLASLSNGYSAAATGAEFPLSGHDAMECIIVDRVTADDHDQATYVLGLQRQGSSAFTIRLLGARLTDRRLVGRPNLSKKVNADIILTLTTVERDGGSGRFEQHVFTPYTMSIKDIDPAEVSTPDNAEASMNSPKVPNISSVVLPLPAASSPTSFAVAVVESNGSLAKEKDRIALLQKVREKIIELTGGAVEKLVKKDD